MQIYADTENCDEDTPINLEISDKCKYDRRSLRATPMTTHDFTALLAGSNGFDAEKMS